MVAGVCLRGSASARTLGMREQAARTSSRVAVDVLGLKFTVAHRWPSAASNFEHPAMPVARTPASAAASAAAAAARRGNRVTRAGGSGTPVSLPAVSRAPLRRACQAGPWPGMRRVRRLCSHARARTPAFRNHRGGSMAGLIEDYAMVGDMQSAALIGRDGSVDWLCVPRYDSAACMAALLGDEGHGQWRISPAATQGPAGAQGPAGVGPGQVSRRYEDSTLILETEWRTADGTVRVIDFMPPRDCETPHVSDAPVLVRIVEGVQGAVEMECVWRLRFDYGKVLPWVRRINHAIVAVAGPDSVWLRTPVRLIGRDLAHQATFTVRAGEAVPFVFSWT